MKARISGIGWITAAGFGQGRGTGDFAMTDGALPEIARKDFFADPFPRFGRLDEFSRLGLSAIALALRDAGLDQWQEKRNFGLIAGTAYGCLTTDIAYFDTVLADGGALASPNLFAYTLANCVLGEAAIRFGLTGPGFVVNETATSRLTSLVMALESLFWGECDVLVAGVCDLPFPLETTGMAPVGPGALFLILSKDSSPDEKASSPLLGLDCRGDLEIDGVPVRDWTEVARASQAPAASGGKMSAINS